MLSVIKIGGNVIDNPQALHQFLADFAALPSPKILVHGGGKIATQIAKRLGIETVMVEGRRITDKAMLEVVTMVYGGLVNKQLVATLQALSCNAIGLTGADGGVIRSQKRAVANIDYGFVGDVEEVNNTLIQHFLTANLVPIFAPLTFDKEGNMLNTNADTQAQEVAVAMSVAMEVNLVYCFEKNGVLLNADDDDSVIPTLTPTQFAQYKADGIINKGMIPKLDNAFKALSTGVKRVTICHASQLREAIEQGNAGTVLML
jgi:acetylglutamate kinase